MLLHSKATFLDCVQLIRLEGAIVSSFEHVCSYQWSFFSQDTITVYLQSVISVRCFSRKLRVVKIYYSQWRAFTVKLVIPLLSSDLDNYLQIYHYQSRYCAKVLSSTFYRNTRKFFWQVFTIFIRILSSSDVITFS